MLSKSGTIFISTRLPDGTISRTPIRAADGYFIDVQKDKTLITPVDEIQGLALNLSEASQCSTSNEEVQSINSSPSDPPADGDGLPLDKTTMSKNLPKKSANMKTFQDSFSSNISDSQKLTANSQQPAIDPFRSELISIATTPPKPKMMDDFDFSQFGAPGAFRQPKSRVRKFPVGNVPKPPYHNENTHSGYQPSANSQKLHIDMPGFNIKPAEPEAINEPLATSYSPLANSQKPIANSLDQSVSNSAYKIAQKRLESITPSHNPIPADFPTPPTASNAAFATDLSAEALAKVDHRPPTTDNRSWRKYLGIALIIVSGIGISMPYAKKAFFEGNYKIRQASNAVAIAANQEPQLPPAVPFDFNPLVKPDGSAIVPVNTEFSLVIPKIGINAEVEAKVDPGKKIDYNAALKKGVAHASTSATPDQQGTVYLFSHSTNYEWYVKSLNAIFYLVKDLAPGDNIIIIYKGIRYTYKMTDKKIVKPNAVSYLLPDTTKKSLILQTCWPPGSTTERMLIFADLIDERGIQI